MEWPDNFDDADEGFDEVLYTDEEAREQMQLQLAELHVAALKAGMALKNLAAATERMADEMGKCRDSHILSQDEIDVGD